MPLNKDLTEQRTAVVESKHPLYLPTNLWTSKPIKAGEAATTFHDLDIKGALAPCVPCMVNRQPSLLLLLRVTNSPPLFCCCVQALIS